jgi:Glycosyltransferase family 87
MSVEAPSGVAPPRSASFDFISPARVVVPRFPAEAVLPRNWRAPLAIAAVPIFGLLLCIAGTRTTNLMPESVRPVPWPMAGPFSYIGFKLGGGELIAAIVMLFASYVFAVFYADRVSPRTVIIAVAVLNVVVLLGPPLFSTDMFSYQAYARMFTHYHASPYINGPSVIRMDGIYQYIGQDWIYTPTVYGPGFTLISGIFASASIAVSEFAFKLIAVLASAGTMYFIWQSAKLRGVNPVRSIALFGLNPLVTLYGVGGGHNDLLMLLLTSWGVYAVLTRREGVSGALITAATAIKLTGAVVLPFALLSGGRDESPTRRHAFLTGAAIVAVIVAAVSFAVFGGGILHLTGTLQSVQDRGAWQSVPGFLFSAAHVHVTTAVRVVFDVALAGTVLWLLLRVWQGRMDWIEGAAWATVAILVTAWTMLPWYVAWLLPLVALGSGRRLWRASMALTLVGAVMMVVGCFPNGL